jgi:hypothetical protein
MKSRNYEHSHFSDSRYILHPTILCLNIVIFVLPVSQEHNFHTPTKQKKSGYLAHKSCLLSSRFEGKNSVLISSQHFSMLTCQSLCMEQLDYHWMDFDGI